MVIASSLQRDERRFIVLESKDMYGVFWGDCIVIARRWVNLNRRTVIQSHERLHGDFIVVAKRWAAFYHWYIIVQRYGWSFILLSREDKRTVTPRFNGSMSNKNPLIIWITLSLTYLLIFFIILAMTKISNTKLDFIPLISIIAGFNCSWIVDD